MAVIWTLMIMVLCWLPKNLVNDDRGESPWFEIPHLDKVVHFALFRHFSHPLGFECGRSGGRSRWSSCRASGWPLLTEFVQFCRSIGRDASVADVVTDVLGVLIGIAVAPFSSRWLDSSSHDCCPGRRLGPRRRTRGRRDRCTFVIGVIA